METARFKGKQVSRSPFPWGLRRFIIPFALPERCRPASAVVAKRHRKVPLLNSHVQLAALGGFTPDCYPIAQAATLHTTSLSPEDSWSAFDAQFDPHFIPSFAA